MGNWNNPDHLSPLEKLEWKLRIATSTTVDNKIKLLQSPKYATLLKLLDRIPDNIFVKFIENANAIIFNRDPCHFDPKKNFINWDKTFETTYEDILYPVDLPARSGKQIPAIQDFVKKGVGSGRRIRGAGMRHSVGNTYSDQHQLLISFFPYKVARGTSRQLEDYAKAMITAEEDLAYDSIENLCMIRKVGEVEGTEEGKAVRKHLVKIGAGVSNDQLRRWCITHGYQCKTNVIMVEIGFVGGLSTCGQGSGSNTKTLPDYVYEIQFIDYNGNRQTVSKKTTPHLIKSAASAMGLLGPVLFVTMEFDDLEIAKSIPRSTYKDFVVPWPKDYPKEKQEARRKSKAWQVWTEVEHGHEEDWQTNFQNFKKALGQAYCAWFYFPIEEIHVFENAFSNFGKKTPENIANIKKDNPDGVFLNDYPPPAIKFFAEFSLFVSNQLANHELTHSAVNVLMRTPFAFFPHRNMYINYPDALHFQRGVQNMKLVDFQCDIDVPTINGEPDYDLIQRVWWTVLEISEEQKEVINASVEMRILKGSEATLAPEKGYEYVCRIEIVRTLTLDTRTEQAWRKVVMRTFDALKNLTYVTQKKGTQAVIIRPHWAKQWEKFPEIKAHVMQDERLKANIQQFLKDYQEIAKLKKFEYQKNISAFSNAIYRELLNNASDPADRIQ